ncbi:hypothetical protein N9T26_01890, partial [Alphaproteobacteria bacterium]|nr:hypothetical protein [Alphaproteobacteria bacterium]
MCGIAGTVFYKGRRLTGRVEPQKLINEIKRVQDGRGSVSQLLDHAWNYKNNLNFLHYWNSPSERLKISQAAENVAELISCLEKEINVTSRSNKRNDFDILMSDIEFARDVLWILSKEVPRIREQVSDVLKSDEVDSPKETLLLFKSITHIINSIDFRLEIRGRDSLGLSVVLVSNSFLDHKKIENSKFDNSVLVDFESVGKVGVYTFVFKTFNHIGGLGDNAQVIRKLIRENKQFQDLVCSGVVEVSSIVAHTRWASVGRIDFPNTLPLGTKITNFSGETTAVTSCLNGDILNHFELVNDIDSRRVCEFGSRPHDSIKCTSDCLALPALLSNRSDYSRLSSVGSLEKAEGSFVVALQESHYPGEVLIFKRGIQGLYIGKCADGIFFASDIYGFVETCRDYCSVDSETFLLISEANDKHDVKEASVSRLKNAKAKTKTLYDGVFQRTEISTRDIDIGEYGFFLEKEINETRHIVEKTIHSFLHFHEGHNPSKFGHTFVISDIEVPEVIVNGLMEANIKNIIITGMGTCYTAAVAISGYMRSMLQTVFPNLLVEPHVASEGSG